MGRTELDQTPLYFGNLSFFGSIPDEVINVS